MFMRIWVRPRTLRLENCGVICLDEISRAEIVGGNLGSAAGSASRFGTLAATSGHTHFIRVLAPWDGRG